MGEKLEIISKAYLSQYIVKPKHNYVPFISVSEKCKQNSITCVAPTKTFNLAGLQTSAVIIPNENLKYKVNRALNTDEIAEPNAFAIEVAVAAFTQSEVWLDELCEYLDKNKQFATEFVKKQIPKIKIVLSNAAYLLWIDCSNVSQNAVDLAKYIRSHTGLYVFAGNQYRGNGNYFLRVNIACPHITLQDGLERLKKGIIKYEQM